MNSANDRQAVNSAEAVKESTNLLVQGFVGFGLVAVLFWASGFSSLIYQVVWTHLLVLVFGSTTFATATVLTVFMGGLALGSFLASRIADRISRPFLWYGLAEGIIALWAIIVPLLFASAVPVYRFIWQNYHIDIFSFSLMRLAVAAMILLIPTTCMGATLPLLARFVTNKLDFVGRKVGTLYAINTAGAVVGATLAGFIFLPYIGFQATTNLAAAINMILCLIVVLISIKLEKSEEYKADVVTHDTSLVPPTKDKIVMLCFAVSGAAAMIYEVAWTRTLLMVIGSSTYAFTVMLATFLLGIFFGSLVCAKFIDKAKQPIAWFACLQFVLCLVSFLSMNEFNLLPWWNLSINASLPTSPEYALAVRFLLASSCLLPLTLCLGAIFPLVVKSCTHDLAQVGKSVGTLYSANTLGAIIGSVLAGFALIPYFGVEKTLVLAAVANFCLGIGLLYLLPNVRWSVKLIALAFGCCLLVWAFYKPIIWDRLILLSAQSERRHLAYEPLPYHNFADWSNQLHKGNRLAFWQDGMSSTVGVRENSASGIHSLVTNGHVDASDGEDMSTQVLLSGYPLIAKGDAKDVCIIGWGSGVTIGTATLFPLSKITAVELEPAVIDASKLFHPVNFIPEDNKVVQKEINDGRNYLLVTDKKFDVIVSEPSNPWQAGVCNLFTEEYFDICHKRLKPGGIFSLWLQTVEVSLSNIKGILKSLHQVYPYVLVMRADAGNVVVLASDRPIKFDLAKLQLLFKNKAFTTVLSRMNLKSPEDVLAQMVVASDGIDPLTKGSEPNIDDTNRLEYTVGRTYESHFFGENNFAILEANAGNPGLNVNWGNLSPPAVSWEMAKVAVQASADNYPGHALNWRRLAYDAAPYDQLPAEVLRLSGISKLESGDRAQAYELFKQALARDSKNVSVLQTEGMDKYFNGDKDGARSLFNQVLKIDRDNLIARYHLAATYLNTPWQNGVEFSGTKGLLKASDCQLALDYLQAPLDNNEFIARHHDVLLLAGIFYYQLGNGKKATAYLSDYLHLEPRSIYGQRLLGSLSFLNGEDLKASALWYASLNQAQQAAESDFSQAEKAEMQGDDKEAIRLLAEGMALWPGDARAYALVSHLSNKNAFCKAKVDEIFSFMKSEGRLIAKPGSNN